MSMTAPPIAASRRGRGSEPLFLQQPRHQLDEVARAMPVIELGGEDALPGIAAGAGRSRQHEHEGVLGEAGRGAFLAGPMESRDMAAPSTPVVGRAVLT